MDNEMIAKMNGLVAKMKEAAEAYYKAFTAAIKCC